MNDTEYRIETVSYQNKKDHRILQACLSKWFKDSKILHFIDPMMKFSFRFHSWVNLSYNQTGITTYILKHERWIIGHISVKAKMESVSVHLFHRRQGHANRLLFHVENIFQENRISRITLNTVHKNEPVKSLYIKIRV